MSYCRFYNTLNDLRDCADALKSGEALSKEERTKAVQLIDLCRDISKSYEGESLEEIFDSLEEEEL